ncbi:hypothetical protein L1887_10571 [Cichorium endivia]|nr:hypothetical protein L1887_10571 [Cichorium endivia]
MFLALLHWPYSCWFSQRRHCCPIVCVLMTIGNSVVVLGLRHCVVDGTWDTIKWSLTFVRDLTDVCLYSYFSMMDDLRKQDPPGGRIEIRVAYIHTNLGL